MSPRIQLFWLLLLIGLIAVLVFNNNALGHCNGWPANHERGEG